MTSKGMLRKALEFFWVAGWIPVSHTWCFPDSVFSSQLLPGYLVLVIFGGSASWWIARAVHPPRKALVLGCIAWSLAWLLSAALGWGASSPPGSAPAWLSWGGIPWSGAVVLAAAAAATVPFFCLLRHAPRARTTPLETSGSAKV